MADQLGPATRLVPVTKSDSTIYLPPLRSVYVGGAGDIAIQASDDDDGDELTFVAVTAGTTLFVKAKRIMSSGTTATNIIGLL